MLRRFSNEGRLAVHDERASKSLLASFQVYKGPARDDGATGHSSADSARQVRGWKLSFLLSPACSCTAQPEVEKPAQNEEMGRIQDHHNRKCLGLIGASDQIAASATRRQGQ